MTVIEILRWISIIFFKLRGNVLCFRFKQCGVFLFKKTKKLHLALIWQSNRWSLGSVLCCIHTPYVSSVITFRSLFGAQWQRDWVGHGLTTVSVSHRQGENMQTPSPLTGQNLCAIVWPSSVSQIRTLLCVARCHACFSAWYLWCLLCYLTTYKQNFLQDNRWCSVTLYCIIKLFYCVHQ